MLRSAFGAGSTALLVAICHLLVQATGSAPVLVLVANGSDITINFPGENNNNRLVSIVSASGNNNPSMVDWIGGNGANKAPSISLGRGLPPVTGGSDESSEDSDPNRRWSVAPAGGALLESDEAAGTLPTVTTATVGAITTTNATASIRNTTPKPTTVAAN